MIHFYGVQEAAISHRKRSAISFPILRLWFVAIALFCTFAIAGTGWAQSTEGAILGTVKDSAGAVVPNATVTLVNNDEGVSRTTTSNESGNYQFLNSKPANYSLTVEAAGFQKWSVAGAQLVARQQLRMDAKLEVGSVQQQVTVSGDKASAIETESNSISAVFTREDAENLPVNNRASSNGTSGLSTIATLPGVQADQGSYSLQGGSTFATEFKVDGVTIQNAAGGGPIADAFPSTEAISELRTDGVGNNAEYGQPGEVSIITKGGTNTIHGAAFWYHQNAAFDSIPYGADSKPHKIGNTFGGQFSGPVVIPHLYNGHDKTFIFGDYEGYRFPQQTPEQYRVPTAAMKNGDFSNYSTGDSTNPFAGLRNPYTGGSYGYVLPSVNAAAKSLLSFYPDPNHADPGTSLTSYTDGQNANYYVNQDSSQKSDQFDIRADQYFGSNQKFLVWGRYTWKNYPTTDTEPLLVPSSPVTNRSNALSTNLTWTIRPNVIDEFHFGFTKVTNTKSNSIDGKSFTENLGLNGLQNLFYNGLPEIDFHNLSSLSADRLSSVNESSIFVYSDSLTWTHGNHNIKFGGDIYHIEALSPLGFLGADNYGTFGYSVSGSAQGLYTGVDFADFLSGIPNTTDYDVVQHDNDGVSAYYEAFIQDQWKATPRLTLSYGLRYELHPGYHDLGGDIGNFDPGVALSGRAIYPDGKESLLAQAYLASANACDPDGINNTNSATINGAPCMPVQGNSAAGFPDGLKHYPKKRVMPRFGFAYRPFNDDRTAIRGGFGMYNITLYGSNFYSLTGTLQAATSQYTNTYNETTHAIGYQWPQISAGNGVCTTCYGTDYFGTANSTNWKDPYTEQWSLSVDHDFGSGYALRVSYIGSETHQLVWAPDENTLPFSSTVSAYNQPLSARLFPNWGVINTRATGANQSYHSLQVEASHRFQHGLTFDSSWTYAKALADNQGPDSTSFAGESGGSRATSILDRYADFGNVEGTRRHRWQTTAVYDLPFGRGRQFGANMPRVLDDAIGGWRLSGIFLWQTGAFLTPYFPGGQGDPSGTGSGLSSSAAGWTPPGRSQHPDIVPGVSWKPAHQSREHWINPAAFACPGDPSWQFGTPCTTGSGSGPVPNPIGRFGNSGVGTITGPGLVNLSAGLSKSFEITTRLHLRAEGTFTNVLNHNNLGQPNLDLSNASAFGTITSATTSENGGNRTGQVSMRLEF
ncbi:carboxypeptidase regulatory-like domain-containing protein [Silvibacterium acidisoli]|uniref:carboxypeptidase regulatory-like domain-containing protein n=1 Tax=Acidobacteriaceae bacterium ZG23-2 TaxID=2883246 RepID=UPI00406C9D2A